MSDSHREFETFAINQEECRKKWQSAEDARCRAQKELDETRANKEKLELQIRYVTELLKNEIQIRQRLQKEEKDLEKKLSIVKQIVSSDRNMTEETRDKLVSFCSVDSFARHDLESPADQLLDMNSEIESSTRSILSSLDITSEKTDDEIELSMLRSSRDIKTRQSNDFLTVPVPKFIGKRLHEDTLVTPPKIANSPSMRRLTPTVIPAPVVTPTTLPAGIKKEPPLFEIGVYTPRGVHKRFSISSSCSGNSQDKTPTGEHRRTLSAKRALRQHNFASKVILKQDSCIPCKARIRFGKSALKCVDCLGTCHIECKTAMPTPCVPTVRTPSHFVGTIADYSPQTCPMVPALMVHCLDEIDLRGMNEAGIYRTCAPEKDIHLLKEQLLHGRIRAGEMNSYSVHVIAGVVKSFLSSLKEPLVTYTSRELFTKIAYIDDDTDVQTVVCSLVPELPQPNRDTLAFLILHLQRVAENVACRMSVVTLAKAFGPMVIGHPCLDVSGLEKLRSVKEQHKTMEKLINITSDYWNCYGRYMETAVTPVYKGNGSSSTKRTGFFTSPHF